jgi:hypothetical protein
MMEWLNWIREDCFLFGAGSADRHKLDGSQAQNFALRQELRLRREDR